MASITDMVNYFNNNNVVHFHTQVEGNIAIVTFNATTIEIARQCASDLVSSGFDVTCDGDSFDVVADVYGTCEDCGGEIEGGENMCSECEG